MAPKFMARIALRPRRPWLMAIVALALLATAGCAGHRRDSLRPVYSMPAAAAAPCTNCGSGSGSSAIVTEPAAGTGTGAAPRPLSSEPAIDEPAGSTDSTVPSLGPPAGSARSSQRNVLPERAPKAVIGDEPDIDMIPPQSTRPRGSQVPSSPTPANQPVLQGPGSSTTPSRNTTDGVSATSASGPVRQASAQQRLNPYFGESGGNELSIPARPTDPGSTSSCTTVPIPRATTTRSTMSTARFWATTAAVTTS